MSTVRTIRLHNRLEHQSSQREALDEIPAVGKNFSVYNYLFLRVDHSSNQQIKMKLTMAYT